MTNRNAECDKMTNAQTGVLLFFLGFLLILSAFILSLWDRKRSKKYSSVAVGTVIKHQFMCKNDISYPRAIVEYSIDGKNYQCKQTYRSVSYNSLKHAKQDWELDENYGLHIYSTRKCERHVNPVENLFPLGSNLIVHYVPERPEKAYCGALISTNLIETILCVIGTFLALFGTLLQFIQGYNGFYF